MARDLQLRAFSLKTPSSTKSWLPHTSLKMERKKKSEDVFFLAAWKFPQGWELGGNGVLGWFSVAKFTSHEI